MKNLLKLISILFVMTVVVCCSEEPEPQPQPKPEKPVIKLETERVEASAKGGEYTVNYTIENPVESVALSYNASDEGWFGSIEITDNSILLTIEANDTAETRTKLLSLNYEGADDVALCIVQAGIVADFTLETESLELPAEGGNISVAFVINSAVAGAELTATADKEWLTSTVENNVISVVAEANTSFEERQATIIVSYAGIERTVAVKQLAQVEEKSEVVSLATVALGASSEERVELIFTAVDGKQYLFVMATSLVEGILPNGDYTLSDKTITECRHDYGATSIVAEEAQLTTQTHNGTTRFDLRWKCDHTTYTAEWEGVVEGFTYAPAVDDSNFIEVEITSAEVYYDKMGEKEIIFYYSSYAGHKFNFKHSDIAVGKPIADGIYSIEEGTMNASYCNHGYNDEFGEIESAKVVVKNNMNEKTSTFRIEWVYGGDSYLIKWTGAVKGYNYGDVEGTILNFAPTYVEVADTGNAGLYFYFYDADDNELVLNYDRGKVYMPYINYDGQKIEISVEDYTFEYADNGDGTYTYNVRLTTLDGRTIEFAGKLKTTVS